MNMLGIAIAGLIKEETPELLTLHPVRRALFLEGIRAWAAIIYQFRT